MAAPLIEVADCTESGNNTATTSWAVSYPAYAAGDFLCFHVASDANVTHNWSATGPNGETVVDIADSYGGTAQRISAFYFVGSATTSAGTFTVTPSASEQWTAVVVKVPAGEFDSTTPVQTTIGSANVTTAATGLATPTWTAGAKADGRIVVAAAIDTLTTSAAPSGWTALIQRDRGAEGIMVGVRDAATTASESIASATFTKSSETHSVIGYVINAPALAVEIDVAGGLSLGGETVDTSLTSLGGNAWATGAWATGAWANDSWDGMTSGGGSPLSLDIDVSGALTATGQSLTAAISIALSEGALTLAGQTADTTLNVALDHGVLTIDGQSLALNLSTEIGVAGSLTAEGQSATAAIDVALSHGSLTISGETADVAVGANLGLDIDTAGSLTAEGQTVDTDLSADFGTTVDPGALTIDGQAVTASIDVALDAGAVTVEGQDVTASIPALTAWASGAWAFGAWAKDSWFGMDGPAGIAIDLDTAGALTVSGETVTTDLTLDLFSAIDTAGSLTVAGESATATVDVALTHGSLTIDGQTADASVGANFGVDIDTAGALTLAGETVTTDLTLDLFVGVDAGALTVDGQSLAAALDVAVSHGTLTIDGQTVDASLPVDQAWATGAWAFGAWAKNSWEGMVGPSGVDIAIDTAGALSVAGQETNYAWTVPWDEGNLSIVGQEVDATLETGLPLSIDTAGAVSVSGQETTFAWTVPWDEGYLTLTGQSLATALSVAMGGGALTISGQTITTDLPANLFASIEPGSLTVQGQSAAVDLGGNISADIETAGALTAAGQSLSYGFSVSLDAGALSVSGQDITPFVSGPLDVTIDAGSLVISGQDVGVSIPQTEITGGGGFVRVPPKSRKKLKEWLERQKITDIPVEAGVISISGCDLEIELTDTPPVYEFNPSLAKPPIKFGSKPTIAKELEAVIVQVDFEAERLAAKKRKRRRQEEDLLLFM